MEKIIVITAEVVDREKVDKDYAKAIGHNSILETFEDNSPKKWISADFLGDGFDSFNDARKYLAMLKYTDNKNNVIYIDKAYLNWAIENNCDDAFPIDDTSWFTEDGFYDKNTNVLISKIDDILTIDFSGLKYKISYIDKPEKKIKNREDALHEIFFIKNEALKSDNKVLLETYQYIEKNLK